MLLLVVLTLSSFILDLEMEIYLIIFLFCRELFAKKRTRLVLDSVYLFFD